MWPSNNSIFHIYVCSVSRLNILHLQNNWRVQLVIQLWQLCSDNRLCQVVTCQVGVWVCRMRRRKILRTSRKLVPSTDRQVIHLVSNIQLLRRLCLIWLFSDRDKRQSVISAIVNNLLRSSPSLRYLQQLYLLMITVKEHLLILLKVANKHESNYSRFMTEIINNRLIQHFLTTAILLPCRNRPSRCLRGCTWWLCPLRGWCPGLPGVSGHNIWYTESLIAGKVAGARRGGGGCSLAPRVSVLLWRQSGRNWWVFTVQSSETRAGDGAEHRSTAEGSCQLSRPATSCDPSISIIHTCIS